MRRQQICIQTGTTWTTAREFSWVGNRTCLLSANRTSHLRTVFAHLRLVGVAWLSSQSKEEDGVFCTLCSREQRGVPSWSKAPRLSSLSVENNCRSGLTSPNRRRNVKTYLAVLAVSCWRLQSTFVYFRVALELPFPFLCWKATLYLHFVREIVSLIFLCTASPAEKI